MINKAPIRIVAAAAFAAAALGAQELPLSVDSFQLSFPKDSPVTLLGLSTGDSRATARGAAMVLDLHLSLSLRNAGTNRIHALTLLVVAQGAVVGGKGRVSLSGLNVGPSESFPLRVDTQLLRPAQATGHLVEVSLDGVLFQDLSFYGPDRENSRRTLTAWEMEAQRDRRYFKAVLAQKGRDALNHEIIASIDRQTAFPQLAWRVPRGSAVTASALGSEHREHFAFLKFPDSPVEAVDGWADVAGNQVRAPSIEVRNRSNKPVKYVELGWLVRDERGQQYLAASVPASSVDFNVAAGQSTHITQDKALDLLRDGRPLHIQDMTGFISEVQFADGKIWVPSRQSLDDPKFKLQGAIPPSNEEQRLTDIYRKHGLDALIEELKKFVD